MENDRFHVVDFHQYVRCDDIEKIIAQRDELLAALRIANEALGMVLKGETLEWNLSNAAVSAFDISSQVIAKCEVKS